MCYKRWYIYTWNVNEEWNIFFSFSCVWNIIEFVHGVLFESTLHWGNRSCQNDFLYKDFLFSKNFGNLTPHLSLATFWNICHCYCDVLENVSFDWWLTKTKICNENDNEKTQPLWIYTWESGRLQWWIYYRLQC